MTLIVKGLTRTFGGLSALKEVDLHIDAGELKGLIGPNGSGKTTLFNVINGLYAPDVGSILFNGAELAGQPMHAIARQGIARTFQQVQLCYDMTALENVMIGAHRRASATSTSATRLPSLKQHRRSELNCREIAMEALRFVDLEFAAATLGRNLSYGQQRLLEIARALSSSPRLLLLDEPAAGLNIAEQHFLIELIQKINEQGIAILLVEHNMRVVMGCCSNIVVLCYGRKLMEGSPDEVRSSQDVIQAYLGTRGWTGKLGSAGAALSQEPSRTN